MRKKNYESKFLTGRDLSEGIRKILSTPSSASVVAFLGKDTDKHFGKNAKLTLNLQSHGTNPFAVEKIMKEVKCRQYVGYLHAKVYSNATEAIVCSANLSKNGLEIFEESGGLEAGVLIRSKKMVSEIYEWCKEVWDNASLIDSSEIEDCKKKYNAIKRKLPKEHRFVVRRFSPNTIIKNNLGLMLWDDIDINEKTTMVGDISLDRYLVEKGYDEWTLENYMYENKEARKKIMKKFLNKKLLSCEVRLNQDGSFLDLIGNIETTPYILKHSEVSMVAENGKKKPYPSVICFYKKANLRLSPQVSITLKRQLKLLMKEKTEIWQKYYKKIESNALFMDDVTILKFFDKD